MPNTDASMFENTGVSTMSSDSGVMPLTSGATAKEAIQGKRIVYLFRIASESTTTAGKRIPFVTEDSRTKSKDADSTATKDGSIRTPGTAEVEISTTVILSKGDEIVKKLEDAMDSDQLIEIWEANLDEPGTGGGSGNKFKGMYFQGYITEFEQTASAEDHVEVSLTFGINGSGKRGDVTVTAEEQEEANYLFKDSVQEGA